MEAMVNPTGGYGPECRFMFPGLSDSLNWGVSCQPPNGVRNWTETTATNNPADRSSLGIMGPFSLDPGQEQVIELAFIYARDFSSNDTSHSVIKLKVMIDSIRKAYKTNTLPGGGHFFGINEHSNSNPLFTVYPNPASSNVNIDFTFGNEECTVSIIDLFGRQISNLIKKPGTNHLSINVSSFPTGLYIIVAQTSTGTFARKLNIVRN